MRCSFPLLFAGLVIATLAGCGDDDVAPGRRYQVRNGLLTTEEGHVLLLRGVNLSGQAKLTPGHLYDLTPEDIDILLRSGINSVRFLTFWKAITPTPDTVDASYLDAWLAQLEALTGAGLYVVIDMHQDLWGVPFATHGAPEWACPAEITAGYEPESPWWINYTSSQVTGCFDRFWSDPDLQAAFTAAWLAVAEAVCPNPRVVGFDLLNEPWPGSGLFDEDWDNDVLLPFYLRVADAIEAVCPGRLYFVEPSAAFVVGLAPTLVIPEERRDRVVFAGHFYPPAVHEPDGGGYDGDIDALEEEILAVIGFQLENDTAVWIGEFGGITTNDSFSSYMIDLHGLLAGWNVSTALWDYSRSDSGFAFLDAEGRLKPVFAPVYATPVPTRVPSPPVQEPGFSRRSTTITFDCRPGGEVEVLLPTDTCDCTPIPAAVLTAFPRAQGFVTATCTGSDHVELTCACTE